MDVTKLLKLLSIFIANGMVSVHCYNISPLSTSKDKWPTVNVLEHDDLHQILISIEERLRVVDNVRYGINRVEISVDRINNKIDSMETRMSRLHTQMDALESRGRLQSVMQMRLDTISQAMISAEMKHEMVPDQVVRKLGISQERLLLRINSIENNVDSLLTKLQGIQNELTSKIQNEMGLKTSQLTSAIDDVKLKTTQIEHRLNSTSKEHLHHLMNIESKVAKNEQVEMLTSRLDGIQYQLNHTDLTWPQNDSPRINDHEKDRMVNTLISEMHAEAHKFSSKMSNAYSEASKRLHAIENAIREHIVETNGTQKELRDKLRQLIRSHKDCEGPKRSIYGDFFDIKTEDLKLNMRMNFANLYDKLDENNRKITNLRTEIFESCSTSQGLGEIEQKIKTSLEEIHKTVNNKSNKIDKQTNDLLTLLKSHSSQALRTEKSIINYTNEAIQDRSNLHIALKELFGQGDSTFTYMQELRRDVDRVLKRDISINRRGFQGTEMLQSNKMENTSGNKTEKPFNRINAVEVHHAEGVIKLLTEHSPNEDSVTNRKTPTTSNTTTVLALPESLNATDDEFQELLKLTSSNRTFLEEGPLDSKDGSIKPNHTNNNKDLPDEFVSHIMLYYIKLLRGQMSLEDFLREANIARTYDSLPEMIKDLRDKNSVSPDFIEELFQYEGESDFDFDELKKSWDSESSREDDNYDYDNI